MRNVIDHYLRKCAATGNWPLSGGIADKDVACAVVIPALAEYDRLFDTLFALSASSEATLSRAQVIVVVNNRAPFHAAADEIADNAHTLAALDARATRHAFAPMRLAYVDASSPGRELPEKEGVGLARKLGADHSMRLLADAGNLDAPIVHLDADSPPAPGYLDALHGFYAARPRWGGYASYRHSIENAAAPDGQAMTAYEIYMRYHELALRYAGSPYAHPALGSIMSSTARAYASAGGMNRRCAGEDFYFMQQLAKTGMLEAIPNALVYPSGRGSHRTPFGTGRVVAAGGVDEQPCATLFHPASYVLLRDWLNCAARSVMASGSVLLDEATRLHPELGRFLERRRFATAWDKIAANHPAYEHRLRQFHVWFDGLRTIQLLHHLRDTAFPNVPASNAVNTLFAWLDVAFPEGAAQSTTLRQLRRLCR